MEHCSLEIDGLRSGLSPSDKPFAIGSSSTFSLNSEHEDSIWGDCTSVFSFLTSDGKRSGLHVESNKGLFLENKIARSAEVFVNPNPIFSELPEVLNKSSYVVGDAKLGLSCVNTTAVMSKKSSIEFDQDDSEEDSPCWKGRHYHKTLGAGSSMRSTDDLNGFRRLNPLAPQFMPTNSKKILKADGEKCEKNSSSLSLKKSVSSTFSSSSGEFNLTDPTEDGRNDAARKTSVLTHTADEISGFVSSDSASKTMSILDSRNEFQPSKRLDPLAPVFVPSSTKLSPSVHEKQGASENNAQSTAALTSSDDLSSTSSYNLWIDSDVGITEYAKPGCSSNISHGQRRLNPSARQFSLADTELKANNYEKNQAADDLFLVGNTPGLYLSSDYWDHNVVDADSPVYVQSFLPNMSRGSSSLISPKADSNIGFTKWFAVDQNPTFSVKSNKDFKHPLPFHVVNTAASSSSSDVKALPGPSPKLDVKKLLTTIHGLSDLLTLAHGSESSESPNADELDLINSAVQNLNSYITNNIQEHAGNQSVARCNSYDLKLSPIKTKVVATSGYQQNHQGEEQINQQALFYKSLWLKAEADRCLMVYETSLLNPNP